MWNGVPAVKHGAIIVGLLLGGMTVFIIDRRLDKVAWTALAAAALSFFGFIHSAALGIHPYSPFAMGYLLVAALCFALHRAERNKWLKAPDDDFEYV